MRFGTALSSIAIATAILAAAQPARAGDEAAAEALFGEAKRLSAEGKFAEACPKFAESNRLDRGAGTLIHLGDCYEKNSQNASAWATYKEAASAAQALNRKDWETLATKRASALEPRLAHLTIKVDPASAATEVTRDGTAVSKASWGLAIPVDAGAHVVAAKAAGFTPFTTKVTVAKDGENVEVQVPRLEAASVVEAPPPVAAPVLLTTEPSSPPDADRSNASGQRTVGFIVGGVGIAGLALGAVTGLMAVGKASNAKDACPNDGTCSSRSAVDAADAAKTLGLVSTIGFIAGGAALAAGAVLVLTAPSASKATLRVVPNAGPKNAGLTLQGSF